MAPRERGRPGFSRRAHYSIFTGYVLAVAGAVIGLALVVVSLVNPDSFAQLRAAAAEIAAPVGSGAAAVRRAGRRAIGTSVAYVRAGSQNAALRREVEAARAGQVAMMALAEENRRLKAMLGLIAREGRPVAVARMIGSSAGSTRRFATLSVGWRHGVRVPMPVRSPIGLIGRVLETGPTTARVLLLTDSENLVPIRRAGDGVAAFSTGRGDGRLAIKLINLGVNPLKPGDVFVTSGSGGLYRPNVPVAVVETLTRDGAIGRIVQDPAAAEFVTVDRVFQQQPAPTPSPLALPPASDSPESLLQGSPVPESSAPASPAPVSSPAPTAAATP